MSVDEYWFGDPHLLENFENATKARQQYELQLAWTSGAYVKSALASTVLIAGLADKNVIRNMPKYAEIPKVERELTKEEIEEEKEKLVSFLKNIRGKE